MTTEPLTEARLCLIEARNRNSVDVNTLAAEVRRLWAERVAAADGIAAAASQGPVDD